MTYTIEITHEDIQRGKAVHSYLNPVSLAIRRVLHRKALLWCEDMVEIHPTWWEFWKEPLDVKLPQTIIHWMYDFESGKHVHPQVFKIDL